MLAFWAHRPFWDKGEFGFAILTAIAATTVAALAAIPGVPPGLRVVSAIAVFLGACGVAGCKLRAKVLDDREKAAKAAEQAAAEQQRNAEVQALRDKAASQARRSISRLLEGLRMEFFQTGEEDTPRATLFVCREPQPEAKLRKCLCIYARAGVYRDSERTWALDDNELTECRGLAGRVWFRWATESVTAACDWPDDGTQAQKEAYANSLGMTLAEAESLNVKARTVVAVPIEVNGERWGVLVLDCRKAIKITPTEARVRHRLLGLSAAAISGSLREVE